MTVHQTNDHPSAPQGNQCLFSHFLASLGAQEIAHQCCDQLTAVKTGYPLTSITWPCRGLKCQPIGVEYFLKFSADKLPVSNDRRLNFIFSNDSYKISCVYVIMAPHYQDFDFKLTSDAKIQPVFYKYRRGRPFFTMVKHWSRSMSNFYVLIGQNLTHEFMWKIYAASWKLFTLTAKADRVLCQLVMFLTVFFHWMYKMKYSCYQESSVIHGWFVYWVFGWEMHRVSKFGNPISDGIVFIFHLA